MTTLEEIRRRFERDLFATQAAEIAIEDARKDYAKCSFVVADKHLNAASTVMGGALFTLADFCFAVASNTENPLTVSLDASIGFLGAAIKGEKLTAEAICVKSSKNTCFFIVEIRDSNNKAIANATFTGFRKQVC